MVKATEKICIMCNHKIYISPLAEKLHKKLLEREVGAYLEKCYKFSKKDNFAVHYDIAIPSSFLNIEIDGLEHRDSKRAMQDLKREFYSQKKGYYTLHIPNELVEKSFNEVVNGIIKFVEDRKKW